MIAPVQEARAALAEIDAAASELAVYSTRQAGPVPLAGAGLRRRMLRSGRADPVASVSLVAQEDGVLLWREGAAPLETAARRGYRGVEAPAPNGELVELFQFEPLPPNRIHEFLADLDTRLNPWRGLYRLDAATALGSGPVIAGRPFEPRGKKRRLVFVHGTFSSCQAFFAGMRAAPNGKATIEALFDRYDEVLAFEHATLAVSPVLNAYDLHRAMAEASGPLDIVAHSRGGLVTRWFLEGFGYAGSTERRAVLVGAPMGGTSLASPPRLRDTLGLLTNIGTALHAAGAAASVYLPFLLAPVGLLKVATMVGTVASKTPLIDAAVQMVPGLAGQSRVGLNPELLRSRSFAASGGPSYFAVRSNFETESPGWRFWRWFRAEAWKEAATDAIFAGPNDLVVDTASMTALTDPDKAWPKAHVLDFGTSATVQHTNYFEQAECLDFLREKLK